MLDPRSTTGSGSAGRSLFSTDQVSAQSKGSDGVGRGDGVEGVGRGVDFANLEPGHYRGLYKALSCPATGPAQLFHESGGEVVDLHPGLGEAHQDDAPGLGEGDHGVEEPPDEGGLHACELQARIATQKLREVAAQIEELLRWATAAETKNPGL